MSGYITFWSKDYVKELEKHGDKGLFCVVYGSHHTRMPSVSSLRVGDIIYPVAIRDKTLAVMARLPVEVIEPAYNYLIRETGLIFSSLIPEGILVKSQWKHGEFNQFSGGMGYTGEVELPNNIHTIVKENELVMKPHKFHQEPITCCAEVAVSGKNGSSIEARLIPFDTVLSFRFGKTSSSQKPLRIDKNGHLTSLSLSGFTRKMSEETFSYFEDMFAE